MLSAKDLTSLNQIQSLLLVGVVLMRFYNLLLTFLFGFIPSKRVGFGSLITSLTIFILQFVSPFTSFETRLALFSTFSQMTSPLQPQLNFSSFFFSFNFSSLNFSFFSFSFRSVYNFQFFSCYIFLNYLVNPSSQETSVICSFLYFSLLSVVLSLSFSFNLTELYSNRFRLLIFFLYQFSGSMSADIGRRESISSGFGYYSCLFCIFLAKVYMFNKPLTSLTLIIVLKLEQGSKFFLMNRFILTCLQASETISFTSVKTYISAF